MVAVAPIQPPRVKLTGPIVVGKDILELLSSAMYVDPLAIYREYVQNAADSLDEAAELGLYRNGSRPAIRITVDPVERRATIHDNGAGVPRGAFTRTLTAIGGSRKRGTAARGFRGVGRLAGLGYCQELVMRSKSTGDNHVSTLYWDCKRLKELLRDPADLTLEQILSEIVEVGTLPAAGLPPHFFEIEMRNVIRYKNDILLNHSALQDFISQVGPVPFNPEFSFGKEIQAYMAKHNAPKTYAIMLNGKPVFRPHLDNYEARPKVHGKFTNVEFFEIQGMSAETDAVGWILHGDYLGAIPNRHGVKGLRIRVGNIQIGDSRLLDQAFPEARFNAWTVGECHVLSSNLIPNARRDDFEQNTHYSNLLGHLVPKAKQIAKACRDRSAERTRQRREAAERNNTNGHTVDWGKARAFLNKNARKPLSATHKSEIKKMLHTGPPTYADLVRVLFGAPNVPKNTPK